MRILFISPRLCLPLISGARLREYYLARSLAEHADVTYVSFTHPGFAIPTRADLPFFREIHMAPLNRTYSPIRIARGLVGRWPLTVLNYTSDAMKTVLRDIVADGKFDLVHLDATQLAAYPQFLQSVVREPLLSVFNWHNIESEVYQRYSTGANSLPRRVYASITARRMAAVERRLLGDSSGHVVCSQREQEQLLAVSPGSRVAVVENGVDTEYFAEASRNPAKSRIVFVGSMDYHANIEAAVWFVQRVWPRLFDRFPEWRLTLVGSRPVPAVRALSDVRGVEVTGTVPDVRPFYREAVAAIVPLQSGGGTRLKVLEAMAAGVPVISTTFGTEGLTVLPGRDIMIADQEEDWLPALNSLAESRVSSTLVAAGTELVRSRYDWRIQGDKLFQIYCRWLEDGTLS